MSKIDLTPHFMSLQGARYLKVAGRLLLFREAHPHGGIHTELITLDWERGFAQYKAVILTEAGAILATAYGSETQKGFPQGWVEKAETVAVGRALAAAGFGTAFALADFHETADSDKLADAPVKSEYLAAPAARLITPDGITHPSPAQIKRLFALVKDAGLDTAWLKKVMADEGMPAATGELSMVQYSDLEARIKKEGAK